MHVVAPLVFIKNQKKKMKEDPVAQENSRQEELQSLARADRWWGKQTELKADSLVIGQYG